MAERTAGSASPEDVSASLRRARSGVEAALRPLAGSRAPGSLSWEQVRDAMRGAGEELGATLLMPGSGVDVDRLAACLGVTCEVMTGERFEGTISPRDGQLVVTLNGSHSRQRRRATLAHELGHALFWDQRSGRPVRRLQYPPWDRAAISKEERACWLFASALLAPQAALEARGLPDLEMTAARLVTLAQWLCVSPDILAQRLLIDLQWYPRCAYRQCSSMGRVPIRSHNGSWIRRVIGPRHRVLVSLHDALTGPAGSRPARLAVLLEELGGTFSREVRRTQFGATEIYWIAVSAGV